MVAFPYDVIVIRNYITLMLCNVLVDVCVLVAYVLLYYDIIGQFQCKRLRFVCWLAFQCFCFSCR